MGWVEGFFRTVRFNNHTAVSPSGQSRWVRSTVGRSSHDVGEGDEDEDELIKKKRQSIKEGVRLLYLLVFFLFPFFSS
jgi:hypothetical protein